MRERARVGVAKRNGVQLATAKDNGIRKQLQRVPRSLDSYTYMRE